MTQSKEDDGINIPEFLEWLNSSDALKASGGCAWTDKQAYSAYKEYLLKKQKKELKYWKIVMDKDLKK